MHGTYCRLGLPVTATNREVIRATMTKLQPRHRFAREAREDRHWIYRQMLAEHVKARRTYFFVVTGKAA